MKKRFLKCAALVLMIMAVLAVPALAELDTEILPAITLMCNGGETITVMPTAENGDVYYWAEVSAQAVSSTIRVEAEDCAYQCEWLGGTEFWPVNASFVDGSSISNRLHVTSDGEDLGSIPLYIHADEPEPVNAWITVQYLDASNWSILHSEQRELEPGDHQISPNADWISGYHYQNASPIWVSVSMDGNASVDPVQFFMEQDEPEPVNAWITVQYLDASNGSILYSEQRELEPGDHQISPDADWISGYHYQNASPVWVSVSMDGNASVDPVQFFMEQDEPDPVNASITVEYLNSANGQVLYSEQRELEPGDHSIWPDASYIDGYDLISGDPCYVSVDRDGNASPSVVRFYASPKQRPSAQITVSYMDAQNGTVLSEYTEQHEAGDYTFYPDSSLLPDGYTLLDNAPVNVSVDQDGRADKTAVSFRAMREQQEIPQETTADITIQYLDSQNASILAQQKQQLPAGVYSIWPDSSLLPEGYSLISENACGIQVYADGTADINPVIFYASRPVQEPSNEPSQEPSAEPSAVPSEEPSQEPEGPEVIERFERYGVTTKGGLNLRTEPSTSSRKAASGINSNTNIWCHSLVRADDGSNWYSINYNGTDCYVSADFFRVLSAEESNAIQYQGMTAKIPVLYLNAENSVELYRETAECPYAGSVTVDARTDALPGWQISGASSAYVSVDTTGNADPAQIAFYFTKLPDDVTVPVSYTDENGYEFASSSAVCGRDDVTVVTADERYYAGYELISEASVSVRVDGLGNADTDRVTFRCRRLAESAQVTVNYSTMDGTVVSSDVKSVPAATVTDVWGSSAVPAGYELIGEEYMTVTADAYGNADPAVITFSVEKLPESAELPVSYRTENGQEIASERRILSVGNVNTVNADAAQIPGYRLTGETTAYVEVNRRGEMNPASVVFTVEKLPESIEYLVRYETEDGTLITSETVVLPANAVSMVEANTALLSGYILRSTSAAQVSVDAYGNADPADIVFTAEKLPEFAQVEVIYQTEAGAEITRTTVTLPAGTATVVQADASLLTGYDLLGETGREVAVDIYGNAQPESVRFLCRKLQDSAEVTVNYRTQEGYIFSSETLALTPGTQTVTPNEMRTSGYELQGVGAVQVTVDTYGHAEPSEVNFSFIKLPDSAEVQVICQSIDGSLNTARSVICPSGKDTVISATLQEGYTLSGESAVTVHVDSHGIPTPAQIVFTYEKIPDAPVIPVYYETADGQVFYTDYVSCPVGYTTTVPADDEKAGELVRRSKATASVAVDVRGVATPSEIHFVYEPAPAATADVTFLYQNAAGKLLNKQTVTLSQGENDVMEYRVDIDGYNFVNASAAVVNVSKKGKADPSVVTFYYEAKPTEAALDIYYASSIGEELAKEVRYLKPGTYTVVPSANYAPQGYVLSASTPSYSVTVSQDLVAAPSAITFTYYPEGIHAEIEILYYDSTKGSLITTEKRSLTPGQYTITPDENLLKTFGSYKRSQILINDSVNVTETGVASPASIAFYYEPAGIDLYLGYLRVINKTDMQNPIGKTVQSLPVNTVLWTGGQQTSGSILWNSAQTVVGNSVSGFVNNADVVRITETEAQALIEEASQDKEPEQDPGYYITILSNVPLRTYASSYSQAQYLSLDTVVYVYGQEYGTDGYVWHIAKYNDTTGYIRAGQIRKLTASEQQNYLQNGGIRPGNTPEPVPTYNPNGPSSYGYVTKDGVNFRSSPNGTRLRSLNKYAMAMIIDSREVNGVTWYNVNYSGTTGWIHGDFLHQMTLSELDSFLGSDKYYEGIRSNNAAAATAAPTGGSYSNNNNASATQGTVSSVEDWNVGTWENTGVLPTVSYAPFNPYATPAPTPTAAPGEAAVATPSPTPTFVIGTIIPINYEDESKDTQTGTVPWGVIIAGILLVGGAGGAYVYAVNRNRKRRAAAARAARRPVPPAPNTPPASGSSPASSSASSPYTRAASPVQPSNPFAQPQSATRSSYSQQSVMNGSTQNRSPYSANSQSAAPYTASRTSASSPYAPQRSSQPQSGSYQSGSYQSASNQNSSYQNSSYQSGSYSGSGDSGYGYSNGFAPAASTDSNRGSQNSSTSPYAPQQASHSRMSRYQAAQQTQEQSAPVSEWDQVVGTSAPQQPSSGTGVPRRRSRMDRNNTSNNGNASGSDQNW